MARAHYAIGRVLSHGLRHALWRGRYRNFVEWSEQAIGVGRNQAYKLAAVVEEFGADDLERYGVETLYAALRQPTQKGRLAVLARARRGATARDLRGY